MQPVSDTTRFIIDNPMRYFEVFANTTEDTIVLLDPADLTIKYINHIPKTNPPRQFIGVSTFEFVSPDNMEFYRSMLQRVLTTGKKEHYEIETTSRFNDVGKAWYECTVFPVNNEAGEMESIFILSRNITESKRQNMEIHNRQEKLSAIINNTVDVIISIDKNLNLTECNSVFSHMIEKGYGQKNVLGTSILNYVDPGKKEHLISIYNKVFTGESLSDIESFETLSGLTLYFETNYNPIYNFDQEITGISIFSKDITGRVLSEKQLKKTLKEREVLLAEIHHRIKNNLALVSSMLRLQEMNLDDSSAKDALRASRKRIRTTALVHEMLYRHDTFDNILLKEYLTELFNNLNVNSNVVLDLTGDDYVLDLNKALPFGLMMHELMMNSFKYSFREGEDFRLSIVPSVKDGFLSIDYRDSKGSFPERMNFNDTSSTGLMLMHTFAEQLKGSIRLTSHEPPAYFIHIPLNPR